ncbi:capsular polysaccharide synthesis enzyme Cap8C [Hydrogenimonas sp.]|nr:capsular polysaccharide synthesis enzyme Cap8C [Hydrogenimonas sp.]
MNFFKRLFSLSKQSEAQKLYVDIHSHLLPGIDDGSKTTYESVKMIKAYKSMGYKKLITTPHIMWHRYRNSPEIILEKLEYLKDALADHEVEIEIEAASEYYLDENFAKLLQKKDILTFGDNYLLFEMSYTRAPKDLREIVFDIESAGYRPVLAHPERYIFMHEDFEEYEELKELGVLFQLNLNSLAGQYSKNVQKIAMELADRGMVDFLGSDVHKFSQIETLKKVLASQTLQQIFEKNTVLNNTLL